MKARRYMRTERRMTYILAFQGNWKIAHVSNQRFRCIMILKLLEISRLSLARSMINVFHFEVLFTGICSPSFFNPISNVLKENKQDFIMSHIRQMRSKYIYCIVDNEKK